MFTLTTSQPLDEAVATISRKTPVGSVLTSREWELVPAEIKQRAMFSARVENERLLAEMQLRLQSRIELVKKDGRTMDRGVFIEELREELRREGYQRGADVKRGSLRDLKSSRRLGLIFDMNVSQAQGYAKWKMDMDPDILDASPCYELIRVRAKREIRSWPLVWEEAGGMFYGEPGPDYPRAPGRMIALKTDPIWRFISRFRTPWPPFDWGSGMGLRSVRRTESDRLGVTTPGQRILPLAVPFNQDHSMSVAAVPEEGRERLRSTFGDSIRFDGDRAVMQRERSLETYEQRKKDISTSLKERARDIAERGRGEIERFRSENDVAAWASGVESEILASTSAVAVGRKQLYHEQWPGDPQGAEIVARLIRQWLPDEVAVMARDGHVHAWRPDLLELTPDQIQALSVAGDNGVLLGYGQNLFVEPYELVTIQNDQGVVIGGFYAPAKTASVYAKSRARDFLDALGATLRVFIGGKEVQP